MSSTKAIPHARKLNSAIAPFAAEPAEPLHGDNVISAHFSKIESEPTSPHDIRADARGSGRLTLIHTLNPSIDDGDEFDSEDTLGNQTLRMIVIGSPQTVLNNIKTLHHLRYANAADWSKFQRGPKPGEVMSVLTRRANRF